MLWCRVTSYYSQSKCGHRALNPLHIVFACESLSGLIVADLPCQFNPSLLPFGLPHLIRLGKNVTISGKVVKITTVRTSMVKKKAAPLTIIITGTLGAILLTA